MATKIVEADLEAMLSDYEEDQEERGGGVGFWKPQAGKNYVRLLPPHENARGRAIIKGGVHWVNGRSVSCPVLFKVADECFLCDRVTELKESGSSEDKKEANDLYGRVRFFANVYDPSNPDNGIKVWEFGRSVYDPILKYIADDDYGNITSAEDGYDLVVTRDGSGMKTKYDVRARKNPSQVDESILELIESDEDALTDLKNIRPFLTDEEMEELYEGDGEASGYTDDDDDEDEEEEKPARRAPARKATSVKSRRAPVADDDEDDDPPAVDDDDPDPDDEDDEDEKPAARTRRPGRAIKAKAEESPNGRSAGKVVDEVLKRRTSRAATKRTAGKR